MSEPATSALLKRCGKCTKLLPHESFPRCRSAADGLYSKCRLCCKAYRSQPHVKARNLGHCVKWAKHNPEKINATARRLHLRRAYGLTPDEYAALLESQGGGCAICHRLPGKRNFAVDHDHETGRPRGLLCNGCNVGLGGFRDDLTLLEAAGAYLKAHK